VSVSPVSAADVPLTVISRDGTRIEGTLAVPERLGPHPTAVIVAGFGPHARDGGFQKDIYRLWSEGLVARGIMTFRYDKRGTGSSGGKPFSWLNPTGLREDLTAVTQAIAARADVKGRKVTLVGHSHGGDLSLAAAGTLPQVARVVTLAAPGRPLKAYSLSGAGLVRTVLGEKEAAQLTSHDPRRDAVRARQQVLIVQGSADQVINPGDADRLLAVRRQAGLPTKILRIGGLDHYMIDRDTDLPPEGALRRVARFVLTGR
jgi:dipeptidyl aminopeptidase/acylaminoacyl peptidase